ncbi:hypothetical protein JL720_13108 [Aureococcus anophagefferens]|nr:hypothetical protein JL720_13108 [Aureococcus anophagefferens]
MAHRKLWAAFRQWDLEARACAAAEGTMRRVLVTMCHRAAHDALRQWVCVVADLKAADRKVLRCAGRMLSCAVAAGWRRWLEVDARCVAVEATVRRTVKHLLHRSQSLAWRLWVAKTIERRVAAPASSSVADGDAVRLRGALYAGFRRWGAAAARGPGPAGRLRSPRRCAHDPPALRRLDRFDAWRGWQTWARFTGEARATAARRERAARDVALFSDRDARRSAGLTSAGDEDLVAGWRERDHRLKVLFWDLDGKRSGALRKALLVWSGANSSHTRNLRIVAAPRPGTGPARALNAWRLLLKDRDALLRAWVLWQAQVWVAQEAYWRAQRIVPEAQRSTPPRPPAMAAAERTVRRMLRKRLGAGWRAWIDALGRTGRCTAARRPCGSW